MVKKSKITRLGCLCLSLVMATSMLGGCGKKKEETPTNQVVTNGVDSGLAFKAESHPISKESDDSYLEVLGLSNGIAYFIEGISTDDTYEQVPYSYDYVNDKKTKVSIDLTTEGKKAYVYNASFNKAGKLATLLVTSDDLEDSETVSGDMTDHYFIKIFDDSLKTIKEFPVSEALKEYLENDNYISKLIFTSDEKICLFIGSDLVVFDAEGNLKGSMSLNSDYIYSACENNDKQLVLTSYAGTELSATVVDYNSLSTVSTLKDYPISLSCDSVVDSQGKYYVIADGFLVIYNPEDATKINQLSWTECDVIQNDIVSFNITEDGRYILFSYNYDSNSSEVIELHEVDPSTIVEKEVITIGTLYEVSGGLSTAIVNFNKQSDKYKIQMVTYSDLASLMKEETVYEAIDNMNNAFLSDSCPDIIDLSYANKDNLVNKGILMDMNDYLNNSKVVKKADMVPGLMEAFTINDTLIAVPRSFYLNVLMGKKSIIGNREGWTVKEFMDFCKQYPEAEVFQYATQEAILYSMLALSGDAFIDYRNLTCNFDSQEFKDILEFSKTFPEEVSTMTMLNYNDIAQDLEDEKVLLMDATIWSMEGYCTYDAMFGSPSVMIGFPTTDGSSGFRFDVEGAYGVSAKTTHKEGVYEFLDYMFTQEAQISGMDSFSSIQSELDAQLDKATETEYLTDENGETLLDENGDPVRKPLYSYSMGSKEMNIYAATEEQVESVRNAIKSAHIAVSSDYTLYQMVYEEAQAYFKDQKSVDEVATVIQSRMQIYISEHN